ncbi:MAG TPA: YebC/PmpR family DNA-binding transcriptional regulator [Bacteroidetes bacterium]|nr:YebC/PmpR family DNA-binding transcriptional regulator [Bacteroidota bacterium]
MGRAFEFRKARKMKRWGQMAKTFTKIGRQISMAVKEGGADPDTNATLRAIIQNAKAANMPKDNVERAIKKASDKGNSENYKEMVYEGYGPHGIAFVIETMTDNTTRTVATVRSALTRAGGSLGTSGSNEFLFDRKCFFKFTKPEGLDLEELELELIDFGGDDVGEDEGEIVIYGSFESFGGIQKYLEEQKFDVTSAEFERIPHDTKELSEAQQADIEKIIGKLEEDDDVQNIYHTMS